MAKKKREDALQTKEQLLDAAEALFLEKGVSHTSLQQIAQTAGLTRGAVYWHFKNKHEVLFELLERAKLPATKLILSTIADPSIEPKKKIISLTSKLSEFLMNDIRTRNAIEIITYKVEHVGEFAIMKEQYLDHINTFLDWYTFLIQEDYKEKQIDIDSKQIRLMARTLHCIFTGLYQSWLIAPCSFDFQDCVIRSVKAYLYGELTLIQMQQ